MSVVVQLCHMKEITTYTLVTQANLHILMIFVAIVFPTLRLGY
jgi:hypothetical protein